MSKGGRGEGEKREKEGGTNGFEPGREEFRPDRRFEYERAALEQAKEATAKGVAVCEGAERERGELCDAF